MPTIVADLKDVGQVACGSSHTLVVSRDGRTVWSFGSGENGKLGHGEIAKVLLFLSVDWLCFDEAVLRCADPKLLTPFRV